MITASFRVVSVLCTAFFVAVLPISVSAQERPASSRYEEQRNILNKNTVTIMGSQAKTSYTEFAQDMQNVLDDLEGDGLRVLPILGRGGGQNFVDVLFLRGIDLGIVEQDVIENFKQEDPALYGNIDSRLRYIVKLSNSEMHFFARPEIKKLEDLRGKKVSFYKPGSSSAQAIAKILGACEIEVEAIYADTDLGNEKLRSGEIAAIGRISGAPHAALANITAEDGHFLPLDEENLPPGCYDRLMKSYLPAFLKHEHYPNVLNEGETVPTVANATILATFNFPEQTERYQSIAKFVRKLFDNIDKFRDGPRHPKWKEVNVAANVPGWTRFKAAQEWIDGYAAQAAEEAPPQQPVAELTVAFESYLQERLKNSGDQQLSASEKRALLDEFSKWLDSQQSAR
ncbi:MAG: TAXI family TRAP transporter solute-binding subunit [Rhodomicrobiaceae bacterium]